MTTLYIIRHGLTPANKENRFAGRSEEPLHSEGIKQIREVGRRLQQVGIKNIFSGPLCRAKQSAELISSLVGAPVVFEDDLTEIRIPHWDGLTKETIRARFGAEYPTWLADPAGFHVPGCETLIDVQRRAVECIEKIFSIHSDDRVLVVSHLIVIRTLFLYYSNMSIDKFRSIKIDNGTVTLFSKTSYGNVTVKMLDNSLRIT